MTLSDYCRHDATGLADLVRRKEISPRELTALARAAHEKVDPAINAVVEFYADAEDVTGPKEGAFAGVPFLRKDVGAKEAGRLQEYGSRLMQGNVATEDSYYTTRAKAAGLHYVGYLTKSAATDLARYGIRVNAVQPGFINTNIFTASMEMPEDRVDQAKAIIAQMSSHAQPVARGGQPDDIANAVAYLASEAASFVTGTSIVVDGGLTIGPRHSWDPEAPTMFAAITALAEAPR